MQEWVAISRNKPLRAYRMVLWLMVALFLFLYLYKFYRFLFIHAGMDPVLESETLFHYPGSYMRRSLLGNLFIAFPRDYWIPMIRIFYISCVALFLVLMCRKSPDVYALAFFLYLPFGLRLVILDPFSLYRKEVAFYPLLLAVIALFRSPYREQTKLTATFALSILMTMIHESFLFLVFPVILGIMHLSATSRRTMITYALVMPLLWYLLVPDTVPEQIRALDTFFAQHGIDWTITRRFLERDKYEMFQHTFWYFKKGGILYYIALMIPVLISCRMANLLKGDMARILALQLFFCLLLSIIGEDYGRWSVFAMVGWFSCLFYFNGMGGLREWVERSRTNRWLFLLALVVMTSYNIPAHLTYLDIDYTLKEHFIWMNAKKFIILDGL